MASPGDEPAMDFHHRRLVDAVELQRVADQVLQQLPHLQRIGLDGGQVADLDPAAGLLDLHFQVGDHLAGDLGQIDDDEVLPLRGHAREREQPVDQRLHPRGGALHPLEAVDSGFVEFVAAHFICSRSPKVRIFRNGSCRSWEAT